jgi:AcrR family transcriptional regulator
MQALDCCETNRERVLAFVQAHFDFLAEAPQRPRLLLQEYLRGQSASSQQMKALLRKYIRPVHDRVGEILRDGIAKREFRDVDVRHFQFSISGMTTMYFISADKIQQLTDINPLSPEQLARRRRAVADFVAAALFANDASAVNKPRTSRKVT